MAAPSGILYPVGLQYIQGFVLGANGYPAATVTGAVYDGFEIAAPKAFDITAAKSRDVVHTGNNRRLSQDKLPAIDVSSATIKASRLDFATNALLTGTKVQTLGEAIFTGWSTDLQGSEPAIALLCYQQAKSSAGARVWHAYHILSAIAIIDPASMNEKESEFTYNLAPSAVGHHIFGPLLTVALNGFTEAEMLEGETVGKPRIGAWLMGATGAGGGSLPMPTAYPYTEGKVHHVAKLAASGPTLTDVTSTCTVTGASGASIGVSGAVAAGDMFFAFYESVG
jgi:hypothetical protein